MTYLEKYKMEHPGLSENAYQRTVIMFCPRDSGGCKVSCQGRVPATSDGIRDTCGMCWNQEIPGTEPTNNTDNNEREDKNMNKNFTKADLKVGYIVMLKSSSKPHMVGMDRAGDIGFVDRDGGWTRLDHYDEFLVDKHPNLGGDWSVMEVYGYPKYVRDAFEFTTDNRELLWKREEKPCDKCAHETVCMFKKGISVNKDKCLHFLNK